eukprot:TRINITY_DN10715_c0_g1_i2.p1 TRINITY_DN10715_c0_g1~~TRINITY_DN10715_c0_g1_i2.p1  ORF type:complete len:275 (-),score=71.51 TRINITY_DN10715_c0_g1_i2:291-1115(-)
MLFELLSRVVGTLYPAYASYKAVRTKNVKEYVRWMMYWIVLAFFTSVEPFVDIFIGFWFPFYYCVKIGVLIWLLAFNGSSILYKSFIHPSLVKREKDIDALLEEAKTKGYDTFKRISSKGVRFVTNLLMEGMIRAPTVMAEFVQTGQLSIENRRFEDVTDQGGNGGVPTAGPSGAASRARPAAPAQKRNQEQQEEMDIDVPDVNGAPEESDFALDSDSERAKKDDTKVGKRKVGRPRKTSSTVDLTFSSGDEQDPDFKVPKQKTRKTTRKTKKN